VNLLNHNIGSRIGWNLGTGYKFSGVFKRPGPEFSDLYRKNEDGTIERRTTITGALVTSNQNQTFSIVTELYFSDGTSWRLCGDDSSEEEEDAQGQGGGNQWNYNEAAAFGMTAAGNTSNLIGTTAEYTAYEMRALSAAKAAKAGVNAVKTVSTGAGIFGGVLTVAIAGYEYKTGQANTHTFVDVGVSALGFAALGAAVIVGAPAIAVGAAVGGLVYGINSAIWMGTAIDKSSGNWGKNVIYGQ